jgi:hypothetical protein
MQTVRRHELLGRDRGSSAHGNEDFLSDDHPRLAFQSSSDFTMSSGTTISESYVGRRIHKKFSIRDMIPGIITAWDAEHDVCHAKYDDDGSEDLDINEMQRSLVPIDNYVGRQIEKRFNRKWYKGTITSWHVEDKLYHVTTRLASCR